MVEEQTGLLQGWRRNDLHQPRTEGEPRSSLNLHLHHGLWASRVRTTLCHQLGTHVQPQTTTCRPSLPHGGPSSPSTTCHHHPSSCVGLTPSPAPGAHPRPAPSIPQETRPRKAFRSAREAIQKTQPHGGAARPFSNGPNQRWKKHPQQQGRNRGVSR